MRKIQFTPKMLFVLFLFCGFVGMGLIAIGSFLIMSNNISVLKGLLLTFLSLFVCLFSFFCTIDVIKSVGTGIWDV